MSEQLTSTPFTPAPQLEPLQVEVTEAARLLDYSRSTIYQMLNSGELPWTRHGTSRRIPVAALPCWSGSLSRLDTTRRRRATGRALLVSHLRREWFARR